MSEGDKYIGLTVGEIEAQRANDRQVGGKHYRTGGDQHWDIVDRYSVPYLEGVASKYPLRWREKGGVEDLEKTLHYIDKIMERNPSDVRWQRRPSHPQQTEEIRNLIRAHGYTPSDVEWTVVEQLLCGFNQPALGFVHRELEQYIRRIRDQPGPGTPEDGGHHARQEETEIVSSGFHFHAPDSSSGKITRIGELIAVTWSSRS